jgi:hypothetical protein
MELYKIGHREGKRKKGKNHDLSIMRLQRD